MLTWKTNLKVQIHIQDSDRRTRYDTAKYNKSLGSYRLLSESLVSVLGHVRGRANGTQVLLFDQYLLAKTVDLLKEKRKLHYLWDCELASPKRSFDFGLNSLAESIWRYCTSLAAQGLWLVEDHATLLQGRLWIAFPFCKFYCLLWPALRLRPRWITK